MKMQFVTRVLWMVLLGVAMPFGAAFGQHDNASSNRPSEALKAYIRNYLNLGPGVPQETMRITVVSVKTEDEAGEEEVVYISGQGWCGVTGGCNMLIVEPFQASFKVIGDVTIVQLPIYLLPSMENGHPDIGVWVAGGGDGTEMRLCSRSMAPAIQGILRCLLREKSMASKEKESSQRRKIAFFSTKSEKNMKTRFVTSVLVMAVLGVLMPVGASFGQQSEASSNNPSEALKEFLRSYLNPGPDDHKEAIRITVVSVKTEDKAGEEEIVYISGPQGTWCGTGGCMMLILEPFQSSFNVLGKVLAVQLPIRLLPSMEFRHPDIGVQVEWAAPPMDYEAVLSFNGTNYPVSTVLPPARKVKGIEGKRIITTTEHSVPLYD